jgi:dipeptidyl aminopeptidase/acylaminoacyl peptidase
MSDKVTPTLRELIQLELPSDVKISPDGARVAILVRTTNWKDDRYDTICQIASPGREPLRTLTRSGSVIQVEWFDEQALGVLKKGDDKEAKAQVWLFEGLSGEGWQVTDAKNGVEWFKPFSDGFVYMARHPDRTENKPRTDRFGKFTHFEQEPATAGVYYVDLPALRGYQALLKASTEDEAKKLVQPVLELTKLFDPVPAIKDVVLSPAGKTIYLNCWLHEDMIFYRQTSVYAIEFDAPAVF